jgi:hypothetical protein
MAGSSEWRKCRREVGKVLCCSNSNWFDENSRSAVSQKPNEGRSAFACSATKVGASMNACAFSSGRGSYSANCVGGFLVSLSRFRSGSVHAADSVFFCSPRWHSRGAIDSLNQTRALRPRFVVFNFHRGFMRFSRWPRFECTVQLFNQLKHSFGVLLY